MIISCHAKVCKQINSYTGGWLTLIILGLITEKQIMRTAAFPGPSTNRAQVQALCAITLFVLKYMSI